MAERRFMTACLPPRGGSRDSPGRRGRARRRRIDADGRMQGASSIGRRDAARPFDPCRARRRLLAGRRRRGIELRGCRRGSGDPGRRSRDEFRMERRNGSFDFGRGLEARQRPVDPRRLAPGVRPTARRGERRLADRHGFSRFRGADRRVGLRKRLVWNSGVVRSGALPGASLTPGRSGRKDAHRAGANAGDLRRGGRCSDRCRHPGRMGAAQNPFSTMRMSHSRRSARP